MKNIEASSNVVEEPGLYETWEFPELDGDWLEVLVKEGALDAMLNPDRETDLIQQQQQPQQDVKNIEASSSSSNVVEEPGLYETWEFTELDGDWLEVLVKEGALDAMLDPDRELVPQGNAPIQQQQQQQQQQGELNIEALNVTRVENSIKELRDEKELLSNRDIENAIPDIMRHARAQTGGGGEGEERRRRRRRRRAEYSRGIYGGALEFDRSSRSFNSKICRIHT